MREIGDGIKDGRIDIRKLFCTRCDAKRVKLVLIRMSAVLLIIAVSVALTLLCTKAHNERSDKSDGDGDFGLMGTENNMLGTRDDGEMSNVIDTGADTETNTAEADSETSDTEWDMTYRDISHKEYGDAYIVNKTDRDLMYDPYAEYPRYYTKKSPYPLVLVLHTNDRREYGGKSIVDVGYELADTLDRSGIATVFCSARHEGKNIADSYSNAAESIEFYLQMYPSIRYIIDVDQLMCEDGYNYATSGNYNGYASAQIRLDVCGKNAENCDANIDLAVRLRSYLNRGDMNVAGEIYVDDCMLNSAYSRYYLTLRIGSAYNTLDEAKNAAVAFAFAFAEHIK